MGGLKAEQVTNSGFLTVAGPAEVESLVNSANATFFNLKVDQTSRDHSIENSANLDINGSLETDDSVLVRENSRTTIRGIVGKTSADLGGLMVGTGTINLVTVHL